MINFLYIFSNRSIPMRRKSHSCLGQYLIHHYMPHTRRFQQKAFLFGCIQPDRNPLTYLKGSVRYGWLRGHNFENARCFLHRISRRLERRQALGLWDYYTLGKLIHYTADAFTFAHNRDFPHRLSGHREYEKELQEHFLRYLRQHPVPETISAGSIMEIIRHCHRTYLAQHQGFSADCIFSLQACCSILSVLTAHSLSAQISTHHRFQEGLYV